MDLLNRIAVALVFVLCPASAPAQTNDSPVPPGDVTNGLPAIEQLIQLDPLPLEAVDRIESPTEAPALSCTELLRTESTATAEEICTTCLEMAGLPQHQDELRQRLADDPGACRQVLTCLDDQALFAPLRDRSGPDGLAILSVLPSRPDVVTAIEKAYFYQLKRSAVHADWLSRVEEWLVSADPGFVQRLADEAAKVRVKETWIEGDRHLRALARVDWEAASPIIDRLVASSKPRLRALGLLVDLTSRPGLDDERRAQLLDAARQIAEDTAAPGRARSIAFDALLRTEWPDRESWYISRFSESGVSRVSDGHTSFAPLCQALRQDPERWIPKVTKLIGSSNRAEHDNAAHCLAQFNLDAARADALRPLLPWLSDPEWAGEVFAFPTDRLRIIQSLDRIDLPESVPGLIWVAEHDTGFELEGAADALARYEATEAVPALREALAREPKHNHRRAVVKALLDLDGLSPSDRAEGVLAFLRVVAKPGGTEALREWIHGFGSDLPVQPPEVSIGMVVSDGLGVDDAVAALLLARTAELGVQEPAVAERLEAALASWPVPEVEATMLDRLTAGTLTVEGLSNLLKRAERLRSSSSARLKAMVADGGATAGIAAVLLGDDEVLTRVLGEDDAQAVRATLASARHLRADLPLEPVAGLLDDERHADLAALYLEARDTPEARELLLARSAGQPRILGARSGHDPGHFSFQVFDTIESSLLDLLASPGGPDEIIALLSAGYWGDDGQRMILMSSGKAEMRLQPYPTMIRYRSLSAEELDRVREFLGKRGVDSLPPYTPMAYDGIQYEYAHLTRGGGVRVFMNNPDVTPDGDVYGRLVSLFYELGTAGSFSSRYALVDSTPGAEILYDRGEQVQTVCGDEHGIAALIGSDVDGDSASWTWHRIGDGGLGGKTEPPDPCRDLPTPRFAPANMELERHWEWQPPYVRSCADGVVVQATWNERNGLWLATESSSPVLIAEGELELPVITEDCRHVVAVEADGGELSLFDLEAKTRRTLDVPPGLKPWMVVPGTPEVLLVCRRQGCADLLLDPSTGDTQAAPTTEEDPPAQPQRAFQSAGSPHLYWTARVDYEEGTTEIGVFDTRDFSFEVRHVLPSIDLEPHQVWIDAASGWAYLATGDLLRVPWPPPTSESSDN